MDEIRKAVVCAGWNLKSIAGNPRTYLCAVMGFLLCFLLTDRTADISREFMTDIQIFEPFDWCFADSDSILFAALVLTLLLAEIPRLDCAAAYMTFRQSRKSWLLGQVMTVVFISVCYTLFLLLSCMVLCGGRAYFENHWSDTATMLSFQPDNFDAALNVVRKTVKLTSPYGCTFHICLLMTQYTLLLSAIQLLLTVRKSKRAGVTAVLITNLLAYLLTPGRFMTWLNLDSEQRYIANLLAAWLSPLQHSTYIMHSFGYDLLPRLETTYAIMAGITALMFVLARGSLRRCGVDFSGGHEYE